MKRCGPHIGTLTVAVLVSACCPQNPPLNSVITAHGNTDWHIDTAEEFLFGTDMNGTTSAANHAPASWSRRHMHVGLTNTDHFYNDQDLTTPGDDTDPSNGIDQAMLFFYAGHGSPTSWDALGNTASQGNMCLGDCPGDGLLRYYWQCSCKVFAHGPHDCTGSTHAYSCPQDFVGSADSWSMRNVFERWGPVLDPDLRMACGASTAAFCHEAQTDRIWNNYNNNGFDVADSFIDGLSGVSWASWVVPLCITTGGLSVFSTPLFDNAFTNQANPSGEYYHIQFLSQFASTVPRVFQEFPPKLLPIFEVIPLPTPDPFRGMEFVRRGDLLVSEEEVQGRGPRVRINSVSGAVYARGILQQDSSQSPLSEEEYVERALRHIEELGWHESVASDPLGASFQIETVPRGEAVREGRKFQKNVVVRIRRVIEYEGQRIPVFGTGGLMTVQMNNDGSLLNASKVWRPISRIGIMAQVKTYEQAYKEALEIVGDTIGYVLHDWTWGYKEEAGNVDQGELRVFYRFQFLPETEEIMRRFPPRIVEIPGQSE